MLIPLAKRTSALSVTTSLSLAVAALLSACGGGSSSSAPVAAAAPVAPAAPASAASAPAKALAGTVAVGISPSQWLLLTGMFVALFLGFAKRRAETFHAVGSQRAVLAHYTPALLDTLMAATMTATLIAYSLFAISPDAQLRHGGRLIYTVPLVIFGMLRYTYQVHRGRGEDVARDLLRDPWILVAGICWAGFFVLSRFWNQLS